jgi:hypothetical protein
MGLKVRSIADIGKGGAARARILTETQKKEIVAAPDPDDRLPASIGEHPRRDFAHDLRRLVNEYELV